MDPVLILGDLRWQDSFFLAQQARAMQSFTGVLCYDSKAVHYSHLATFNSKLVWPHYLTLRLPLADPSEEASSLCMYRSLFQPQWSSIRGLEQCTISPNALLYLLVLRRRNCIASGLQSDLPRHTQTTSHGHTKEKSSPPRLNCSSCFNYGAKLTTMIHWSNTCTKSNYSKHKPEILMPF